MEIIPDYPVALLIPPHLWNGFPQDINKHMAANCTDCSSCHLWCHFGPYVRVRSQRTGLCQYGPLWVCCLSWPEAMGSGNGPVTLAYHYVHVWDLRELSAKRAHIADGGYLNHKAQTQIRLLPASAQTLDHDKHWQSVPLLLGRAQAVCNTLLRCCVSHRPFRLEHV